jgi:hypothetical protein
LFPIFEFFPANNHSTIVPYIRLSNIYMK